MNTKYNVVHQLKKKPEGHAGFEAKCNWRYWGIAVSWGDSFEYIAYWNPVSVWFIGAHIGPLFLTYSWPKSSMDSKKTGH